MIVRWFFFFQKFFLAGSPQLIERGAWEGESRRGGNVFRGFADDLLEQAFKIDHELVRKIKGENDERDRIVQANEDFEALLPESDEQERERERHMQSESENGIEETICTLRLKHDIDRSERADIFNPRGGRISTANYHNLPVLRQVRLSAERGVLYSVSRVQFTLKSLPDSFKTPISKTLTTFISPNLQLRKTLTALFP